MHNSSKIKTVNILIFSVMYLFAVCFSSVSFATTDSTGYENIEEASYYIQNYYNGLYIKDLDYFSAILSSYSADSQQRWEFIYVSNGYYNIKNSYNGKYLTAPSDSYDGSLIEQNSLSASYTDRQLWSITPVYVGADSYYIYTGKISRKR